ncbi:hypothetical protein FRX31_019379 [Thalictrum thalictroides]|uniref:Uncharacterized protein n=1 Tax=Thalictrum thalictroides TaxID=46969 RepID=A0A7J6W1H7_THATH|nr:hypothetical protein FRX31_019379 [Thalictrum thalictroides]
MIPFGLEGSRHQNYFRTTTIPTMNDTSLQMMNKGKGVTIQSESQPKLTYAEKARQRMKQLVDLASLPIPSKRGESVSIRIPSEFVEKGLEVCKYSLVWT